jgi:hypothetical protein
MRQYTAILLQYFCLENSMDRGAWKATVAWWLWGHKESDMTERLNWTESECTFNMKESMDSIFPPKFQKLFKHFGRYMQTFQGTFDYLHKEVIRYLVKYNLVSYIIGY